MKTITYVEFEKQFQPLQNPFTEDGSYNNCAFETYEPELTFVKQFDNNKIWTLVDGDNENWYIIPGYHFVNRQNYFVTEIPWEDENIEVDDNERIKIKDAVEAGLEFAKSIGITLNESGLDISYFDKFKTETITIGDAKYHLIDYLESLNINLTSEQEDEIHNFYSQLV